MSGLIDVLSGTGLRTGEILPRSEVHRLGKYHRTVHLYILNSRDELLLQKRSASLDHFPGMFGISITGHIDAGECSSEAVRREVQEELGLDPSGMRLHFLFSFYREAILNDSYIDRQFTDVYAMRADVNLDGLAPDPSEVAEVRFVPFDSFRQMVADGSGGLAPVYAGECRDVVYFLQCLLADGGRFDL